MLIIGDIEKGGLEKTEVLWSTSVVESGGRLPINSKWNLALWKWSINHANHVLDGANVLDGGTRKQRSWEISVTSFQGPFLVEYTTASIQTAFLRQRNGKVEHDIESKSWSHWLIILHSALALGFCTAVVCKRPPKRSPTDLTWVKLSWKEKQVILVFYQCRRNTWHSFPFARVIWQKFSACFGTLLCKTFW